MVRIKICGITNIEDALSAVDFGADAMGFVFHQKSPRAVDPETAGTIISEIPPFVTTVGVFVDENKQRIEQIAGDIGLDVVQLHGYEPPEACFMSVRVIKAIRVRELTDLEQLRMYNVSAFLLDTFSPYSAGGTGQTFNWDIAVEARKFGRIILAGGLSHDNVGEAVRLVQPYGVDVSTGVEGPEKGRKDREKLKLFINEARRAAKGY
jgi:phosphoribosylanthranilate isomerase